MRGKYSSKTGLTENIKKKNRKIRKEKRWMGRGVEWHRGEREREEREREERRER